MTQKKFNIWNRCCAALAFVISALTYLLTIEPSASFWDCGEFIASSYKLEVGHPPGNPVFQLIARVFTMFGDNMHAAILVNAMSAICSALTIFLLYLTIVWFVKRMVGVKGENVTLSSAVAVIGSGLVGSLVYCFSDTFWFSAVEGEVYAMSSLFTALVFWAMTMWYDRADEPHALRWIVLIAFLMGLSIGVHLLNLLAIPALVFMFWYRRHENEKFGGKEFAKVFLIGVAILAVILFVIIPWLPKMAAYFDLFFVNVLGLPYNTGAAFFMIGVIGLCFWGMSVTLKKEKVFLNTALLCLTSIIVGFSVFSVDVIRSCAKTPTNEYQPDNAFTLVRYLSREQYGKTPLIYGQYYDAPYDLDQTRYWAPLNGKYKKVEGPVDAKYKAEGKMLFPRMWSGGDVRFEQFYESYTHGKGHSIKGAKHKKPTMGANLAYFFNYQINWMYLRYFMWNFVGRQNEIHSPAPGNIFYGNWESGIGFLDRLRLGDQRDAPEALAGNKGKNHYFFLPLLLGLIGLCFQFDKDKRGCWLAFLMFFMTGLAIVIYLNQPPYQVRERDYAYAGSFYFFSVWVGLGVAAIASRLSKLSGERFAPVATCLVAAACLIVPAEMAAQNWDDHDRSNRRTAVEMARNYLSSVGENGILVTHGDNDTFPLWYAQEVENVRTDVRICNTSLLGTDWHIDQMTWASNESTPLNLQVPHTQYLYGTNEYVPVYDSRGQVMDIRDVMKLFREPRVKVGLASGRKVDYIASRKISVPVNKENAIKYGIIDAKYEDIIPESILLTIPEGKEYLSKPELFMLDLLSGYQWDRPINLLNMGGDINIGLKDYLEYQGYSYKLVPLATKTNLRSVGFVDTEELWKLMSETYSWDAVTASGWYVDYQNIYTHMGVMSLRSMFVTCADAFLSAGQTDRASAMLDKALALSDNFPLEGVQIGFSGNDWSVCEIIRLLFTIGRRDEALELADKFNSDLLSATSFFLSLYEYGKEEFEACANYIYYVADILKNAGEKEKSAEVSSALNSMLRQG